MQIKVIKTIACLLIAMLALPAAPVHAINLKASATLRAEVGLDAKTRALIQGLPTEVRVQVIQLLQEALPLIDQSVQAYLDRINDIVDAQVINLSCAASGVGKSIVDDLSNVLGGAPTPIADLRNQSVRLETAFKKSSKPDDYRVAYADFLRNGNVTACSIPGATEALVIINGMRADATARTRLWNRLYDMQCTSAESCLVHLRSHLKTLLDSANMQDLAAIDAKNRFTQVDMPRSARLFDRFRQAPYESRMGALFDIEDELALAKQIRVELAKKYLELGVQRTNDLQALLNQARSGLNPNSRGPNQTAINQVAGVQAIADEANQLLQAALEKDQTLSDQISVQRALINQSPTNTAQIIAIAQANLTRIAQIERLERMPCFRAGGGGGIRIGRCL